MASPYSVTTRDNPSKLGFSSRCSRAWPLFKLSLVSFSPLNTYIARYAHVRRTEIYCAIARKLSHPTPNRVPSSLLEWPRCEGGRLVKLIYRTSLQREQQKDTPDGCPSKIHKPDIRPSFFRKKFHSRNAPEISFGVCYISCKPGFMPGLTAAHPIRGVL